MDKNNFDGFSLYASRRQKYRNAYNATGHTMKEYTRKRQLSNALAMIKASEIPLAEIAYLCGFSSQQALCRSVKARLGITPTEYKSGDTYYFFPSYKAGISQTVTVAAEQIPDTVCFKFYNQKNEQIEDEAIKSFFAEIPRYTGRIFGRNGKHCYELYLTETEYKHINGFTFCGIKSGFTERLATTVVNYNEKAINAAWDNLYNKWLPTSMFQTTDNSFFEEYNIKNGKPVKLKLCIPIKKREEEMTLTIIQNPKLCFVVASAIGYNAEKDAAIKIIEFMNDKSIGFVSSREFLVAVKNGEHTCGIKVNPGFDIINEGFQKFETSENYYAVLKSNVIGDYNLYVNMLYSFVEENNLNVENDSIFAVYDADNGYENPTMKLYIKINFGTK